MIETRILLVRHPETEANIDGRYVGHGDSAYTERGSAQARRLVEEICGFEPVTVWTSPLRRTAEVARAAVAELGCSMVTDDRLIELDFGVAEGLTFEETARRGIAFEFGAVDTPVAPEGESRRDIYNRTAAVLDEALSCGDERIAVVTHGGVFRSGVVYLLGLGIEAIWKFHIQNAQLAEFTLIDGHARMERFVQADRLSYARGE